MLRCDNPNSRRLPAKFSITVQHVAPLSREVSQSIEDELYPELVIGTKVRNHGSGWVFAGTIPLPSAAEDSGLQSKFHVTLLHTFHNRAKYLTVFQTKPFRSRRLICFFGLLSAELSHLFACLIDIPGWIGQSNHPSQLCNVRVNSKPGIKHLEINDLVNLPFGWKKTEGPQRRIECLFERVTEGCRLDSWRDCKANPPSILAQVNCERNQRRLFSTINFSHFALEPRPGVAFKAPNNVILGKPNQSTHVCLMCIHRKVTSDEGRPPMLSLELSSISQRLHVFHEWTEIKASIRIPPVDSTKLHRRHLTMLQEASINHEHASQACEKFHTGASSLLVKSEHQAFQACDLVHSEEDHGGFEPATWVCLCRMLATGQSRKIPRLGVHPLFDGS